MARPDSSPAATEAAILPLGPTACERVEKALARVLERRTPGLRARVVKLDGHAPRERSAALLDDDAPDRAA